MKKRTTLSPYVTNVLVSDFFKRTIKRKMNKVTEGGNKGVKRQYQRITERITDRSVAIK